ncbi:polymorphic toxin-type HINT domain-containing protein, partial [Sphaerisporangium flaviroseum]|uniref:polymorphic toxin-type HINT domain-containing protein n=1 Tax=Sphaerisporangium flaviroseum TaxID=509199 RepID=UPI0031E56D80
TNGPKRTYSYDSMDRLTGDTLKTSAGAAIASITYGYDRDDNLTTKTTAGTAGAGTNTYTYDHSNRLTSWTAPGGAVTDYAWDDSGNRIQAGAKTFTYDERNRLLSGDGTYTYTARGTTASETKSGVTKLLKFDAFDRMTSDGEATYTYDALDRVTSRTQGGAISRYLYGDLANDIVAMTDAAGVKQATYSRGIAGEPIGISDGTGPRFAFADQHGDVVGTFQPTGTSLADSVAYNPFGEETGRNGAKHALGYQGEFTDPTTGKVNMHARWYQPGTGTFSSRDTWTLNPEPSGRANRYAYGNASPLSGVDPSGHEWVYQQVCGLAGPSQRIPICTYVRVWEEDPPKSFKRKSAPPPVDDTCSAYKPQCRTAKPDSSPGDPCKASASIGSLLVGMVPNCNRHAPTGGDGGGGGGGGGGGRKPAPPREPVIDCRKGPQQGFCDSPDPHQTHGCGKKCGYEPYNYANDDLELNCDLWSPDPDCPAPDPDLVSCLGTCGAPANCGNSGSGGFFGTWYVPCSSEGEPTNLQEVAQQCSDNIICDLTVGDAVNCIADPNLLDCVSGGVSLIPGGKLLSGGIKLGGKLPKLLKPAAKCLTGNSFIAGTLVLMADGTSKSIEDVQVGDLVQATDPESGQSGPRLVLDLITGDGDKSLIEITVNIDGSWGNATDIVIATDGHSFWVPGLRKWLTAAELRVGMLLHADAGATVKIAAVRKWTSFQRVHNLTVAGLHTYYVQAGVTPVLVHNDGGDLTPEQHRSIQSYQDLIAEHEKKLADYLADPDAYDNKGFLKNAPNDEVRQRIIDGRARHLRQEIRTFQDNIKKIGLRGCK